MDNYTSIYTDPSRGFDSVFSPAIINHSQASFLGPALLGCLLEAAMFGVVVVQFHSYLSRNEDGWMLRTFVGSLCALAFTGTILAFISAYSNFVVNYGNKMEFLNDVGTLTAHHAVTVLVVGMVELYFAYRVFQVSKRAWFVSLVISFFALSGFVCGITSTTLGVHWNSKTLKEKTAYWITSGLSYTFPVLSSTISTISLCVVLRSVRTEALWTHSVVNSLIIYTINRGLLVTVTQTVMMILVFVAPQRLFWAPFYAILNKVCLSTLLVMLNSRTSLRSKSGINAGGSGSGSGGKDGEMSQLESRAGVGGSTRAANRMSRMSKSSKSYKSASSDAPLTGDRAPTGRAGDAYSMDDMHVNIRRHSELEERERERRNHWSLLEASPQFLQPLSLSGPPYLSVPPSLQQQGQGVTVQVKRQTLSSMDDVGFE